ncbi:bifunctional folylpolyglutamate synthase/dihydrofolate synthase [Acutalibacter sp. 1XD8-33]|uniref:bifunctional folylpolyglutamate synthase/dihydrofolate synthase n=1 Tax=Acutalibacter sp. 1XD8-33 TaxID=2320081 RepID=UPI000EA264DE|nr:folylpolyglutamate synthase/dihydrofolate synthase family protein [Acutalibacter sp. 1XD8-33]RKJ41005.1 bifunctional folylpolyglutamate synthase/dihydrofolate synthase [Acutalibacter sp. 1XD8-33]
MTYAEALEKINSRLLFGMKPGLERMERLMERLGNPQKRMKFVHVCGTNGKGSACTLTASVLRESGYPTGLNISPYVMDFRERFQINGEMISKEELARELDEIWPVVERLDREECPVSEFELVTAIALHWFAKKGCDIAVMEVGMGGLMDATNIIPVPEAAAMMSISLDHTAWLGDTVEQIAREKAGIIKDGGRVVLYPEQRPGVREIVESACREHGAQLRVPDLSRLQVLREGIDGTDFQEGGLALHTPFLGAHQVKNAAVVLEIVEILRERGFSIPDKALVEGFAKTFNPARMEILSRRPLCLLDGGHNPGCAQALRDALERFVPGQKTALMGMMADKDSAAALKILGPLFQKVVTVTPENPRSLSAEALAEQAGRFCREALPAESCREALDLALEGLGEEDALIVCGSFYLAGEIRPLLLEKFSGR